MIAQKIKINESTNKKILLVRVILCFIFFLKIIDKVVTSKELMAEIIPILKITSV